MKKQKKHKVPVFRIFIIVYTLILIACAVKFLKYTDECLVKYEKAQSENAMPDILFDFKKMVKDGSIVEYIELPDNLNGVDEKTYKEAYLELLRGQSNFSYEKDSASYLTESPIYDVLAGGKIVGKIQLSAINERTIFGILTIMDWKAQSITPVFELAMNTYTITVPDNYKVSFNGEELGEDRIVGDKILVEGMDNLLEYVELPCTVKYEVSSARKEDEITILDEKGKNVKFKPDKNGNISIPVKFASKEMPQDRQDIAYEIAKLWEDFVTDDLDGKYHGLATIQKYLVKDSVYYKLADEYGKGPDIGLVSDHVMADPGYSDLKIDNYIEYSDTSFSCHIYFNKNMKLTRAHNKLRTETVDSTFYFVYLDDTTEAFGNEDNEDNPHWCMVDMVATTK